MPMYRYVCENCGNEKVVFHSMNEKVEVICDRCGHVMKKTIGRVGVIFKGSGFYTTDYKKSSGNGKGEKKKSEGKKEANV
jgi:putative FmdB family regulatory protein